MSWRTCGRRYEILEVDSSAPAQERQRMAILEVSAKGIAWIIEADAVRLLWDGASGVRRS
jgi:hypothetical protein